MLSKILFVLFYIVLNVNCYLFWIEPRNPLPLICGTPSAPGSPWPLPQIWEKSQTVAKIGSRENFKYEISSVGCEPINWATNKFNYDFLFGNNSVVSSSVLPTLSNVLIYINDENGCNEFPKYNTESSNEEYFLRIDTQDDVAYATITAQTVWGAIRGVETFSQLLYGVESIESDGVLRIEFFINVTSIYDFPRFPHRGLMLDTARHYIPESTIIQVLDAMFYTKLNVFHWHIVDDQSFPFVSRKFPDLSLKGAYTSTSIYSPDAVKRILNEARLRGIRVIFEFDTPGHTNSMGRAYPELLTPCYGDGVSPGTPNYPEHAAYENLDPTRESTYDFTRELFSEIVNEVSGDEFIHLGMDEVYMPCWNSSPIITQFMINYGYENLSQVQGHYTNRHLRMIESIGGKAIMWQDPLDAGVEIESDVIVQIWKDWDPGWQNYTKYAISKGHKVILSAPWYVNYIGYGQTWKQYYEVDPINDIPNLEPGEEDFIVGGEACLWAEYVDKTNIVPRLFPFVSAVGERLWSASNSSSVDDAMWRLDEHRCRLLWRGISAQPISPGYCGSWEV